jgi:hypothetical protein
MNRRRHLTYAIALATFVQLAAVSTPAAAAEVVSVSRWEFHSSFWMSLHQTLMHEGSEEMGRDAAALSAEERGAWDRAVAAYRQAAPESRNLTFEKPMFELQDQLRQVADDANQAPVTGPLAEALSTAAPVYRQHWWPADDAANRFFIGYAVAMLRDAGEELALAHERIYGAELPARIRVDIAPYGGRFGAYTLRMLDGKFVTTMSSREVGYQGMAVLEMIPHEISHAIVTPRFGTVARAIASAATKRGIEPPPDLWHAILFATSGELAKRALAARGVASYVPASNDMLSKVWPKYREPIETHWLPYLSGKGTLQEAIEKVVATIQ